MGGHIFGMVGVLVNWWAYTWGAYIPGGLYSGGLYSEVYGIHVVDQSDTTEPIHLAPYISEVVFYMDSKFSSSGNFSSAK